MRIGIRSYTSELDYEVDELDFDATSASRGLDDLVEAEIIDEVSDVQELLDLLNAFLEDVEFQVPKGYAVGLVKI